MLSSHRNGFRIMVSVFVNRAEESFCDGKLDLSYETGFLFARRAAPLTPLFSF